MKPITIHQARRARFIRQCQGLAGVIAYVDSYWYRRPRIAQKTAFVVTFERLLRSDGPRAHPWHSEIQDRACGYDHRRTDPGCSGCWRQREESPLDQIPDARGAG